MLIRSLSCAVLVNLAAAQSPQTHPRSVDDLLPASTYAAMRFGGLEACRQATEQLPVSTLFRSLLAGLPPELRDEYMDRDLDAAAEQVRQALQEVGLSPADVRALVGQPMAVGLGRLSIEGMGPSVALLIEEGNHLPEIERCCQAALRMLPRLGANITIDSAKVAGIDLQRVQSADGPPLFLGSIGGTYCISNSRGYVAEIVQVAGGSKPGLIASTRLSGLRRQLPTPPLMSWALNIGSVLGAFAPHLPYEADDFADALGLGGIDVVYAAATAGSHGGTDLLHVGVGGSEHGLAKALVAAPVDLAFAKACSENTVVFGAGSLDIPSVMDAFQRFTKLLPPAVQSELSRQLHRELGRELRHMGTSTVEIDSMLRAFGNQVGFAIALEKGAVPKPELLVRLSVRDAGPVVSLMQRVEAAVAEVGAEWRSREVGEHVIRFCNVPLPEAQLQISPCYVIVDDGLWFGSDVAGLVKALRRADEFGESLAAEDDFVALQQDAAGASGVLHVRSFRGIEIGWRAVETMLYPMLDAQSERLGFDSDSLPDSETLAAALGTTTFVYRVDDNGITVKSDGAFAFGALLAAMGALGDHVFDRATGKVY